MGDIVYLGGELLSLSFNMTAHTFGSNGTNSASAISIIPSSIIFV